MRRLPDDSLTHAIAQGGHEHFGWGVSRHLLADIYDAINQNTRATGNWKKPPKIKPWPRPRAKADKGDKKPRTVADLFSTFSKG